MKKPIELALIMGTRPEIIKFAPLIALLQKDPRFKPVIISTGQHQSMNTQAFSAFSLTPDHELALMKENQTPVSFLSIALAALEPLLSRLSPRAVIVQGDTSSALAGALTAFHLQIPIMHLEAGLRTFSMEAPFPEEMNRSVISRIASLHFCPTKRAAKNLEEEGICQGVYVTGNTVVDAAALTVQKLDEKLLRVDDGILDLVSRNKKIVLVTGHRRENLDGPLSVLCNVLGKLHNEIEDLCIIYPLHKNPKVRDTVSSSISNTPRIHLLDPLDYPSLIYLIRHSTLIITDSGGIQEEAPTFCTPVLVTRCSTERPEAIETDCARLCPLDDPELLYVSAKKILENPDTWRPNGRNPFGDGQASKRIVDIIAKNS